MQTAAEYQRAYRMRHPERAAESARKSSAKWRLEHLEEHREKSGQFRAMNPKRYRAYTRKSRTIEQKQTPRWANMKAIIAFYEACPEGFTVDHIIPFRSPLVCGMHVESNLQYLTLSDNARKKNRFVPIITSF